MCSTMPMTVDFDCGVGPRDGDSDLVGHTDGQNKDD